LPELTAFIADAKTAELVRENAAFAILLLHGANQPEGISVLVRGSLPNRSNGLRPPYGQSEVAGDQVH